MTELLTFILVAAISWGVSTILDEVRIIRKLLEEKKYG
jgi:hypothetical protein